MGQPADEATVQVKDTSTGQPKTIPLGQLKQAVDSGKYETSDSSAINADTLNTQTRLEPDQAAGILNTGNSQFIDQSQIGNQQTKEAQLKSYNTAGDTALTFAEGVTDALTFGFGHERGYGPDGDPDIRRGQNPNSQWLGEMTGIALGLVSGSGEAKLAELGETLGKKVAGTLLGEGKVGSIASKMFGEAGANAAISAAQATGHQSWDALLSDKPIAVEAIAHETGMGALLGAGFGGAEGFFGSLGKGVARSAVEDGINAPEFLKTASTTFDQSVHELRTALRLNETRFGILNEAVGDYRIPDDFRTDRLERLEAAQEAEANLIKQGNAEYALSTSPKQAFKWQQAFEEFHTTLGELDQAMTPKLKEIDPWMKVQELNSPAYKAMMDHLNGLKDASGEIINPDQLLPGENRVSPDIGEANLGGRLSESSERGTGIGRRPAPMEPPVEPSAELPESVDGRPSPIGQPKAQYNVVSVGRKSGPRSPAARALAEIPEAPQTPQPGVDIEGAIDSVNSNRYKPPHVKGDLNVQVGEPRYDTQGNISFDKDIRPEDINAGDRGKGGADLAGVIGAVNKEKYRTPNIEGDLDTPVGEPRYDDNGHVSFEDDVSPEYKNKEAARVTDAQHDHRSFIDDWVKDYKRMDFGTPGGRALDKINDYMKTLNDSSNGRLDAAGALNMARTEGFGESTTELGNRFQQAWSINKLAKDASAASRLAADRALTKSAEVKDKIIKTLGTKLTIGVGGAVVGGGAYGQKGAILGASLATGYLAFGGKVAGTIAKLKSAVTTAGQAILKGSRTTIIAQASSNAVSYNHPWSYSDKGPIKDPIERIQEIQHVAAHPDLITAQVTKNTEDLNTVHSELHQLLTQQLNQRMINLSIRAPKFVWDKFGQPLQPAEGAMRKFLEYENATNDLVGTLHAISKGMVTQDQSDGLRDSWPAWHTKLSAQLLNDPAQLKSLGPTQLNNVEKITGLDFTGKQDPQYVMRQQAGWAVATSQSTGHQPNGKPQAFKINNTPSATSTVNQSSSGRAPGN